MNDSKAAIFLTKDKVGPFFGMLSSALRPLFAQAEAVLMSAF